MSFVYFLILRKTRPWGSIFASQKDNMDLNVDVFQCETSQTEIQLQGK